MVSLKVWNSIIWLFAFSPSDGKYGLPEWFWIVWMNWLPCYFAWMALANWGLWSKELTTQVLLLCCRFWPFTMHLQGRNFEGTLKTYDIRRARRQIKQINLKFSPFQYSIKIFLKHLNLPQEQPPNLAIKRRCMSDNRQSKPEIAKCQGTSGGNAGQPSHKSA